MHYTIIFVISLGYFSPKRTIIHNYYISVVGYMIFVIVNYKFISFSCNFRIRIQ